MNPCPQEPAKPGKVAELRPWQVLNMHSWKVSNQYQRFIPWKFEEASLLTLEWHLALDTLDTCCGTGHKQIPVSWCIMFVESSAIHHSHTTSFYDMQCCSILNCRFLSARITVAAGFSCSTLGWALLCPGASPGHLVRRTCQVHNYITHVLYCFIIFRLSLWDDIKMCFSWFYGVFVGVFGITYLHVAFNKPEQ